MTTVASGLEEVEEREREHSVAVVPRSTLVLNGPITFSREIPIASAAKATALSGSLR